MSCWPRDKQRDFGSVLRLLAEKTETKRALLDLQQSVRDKQRGKDLFSSCFWAGRKRWEQREREWSCYCQRKKRERGLLLWEKQREIEGELCVKTEGAAPLLYIVAWTVEIALSHTDQGLIRSCNAGSELGVSRCGGESCSNDCFPKTQRQLLRDIFLLQTYVDQASMRSSTRSLLRSYAMCRGSSALANLQFV